MNELKANERFLRALKGEEVDRLPKTEIAFWWDETVKRWQGEGLPKSYQYAYHWKDVIDLQDYFGLDMIAHWWVQPYSSRTIWRGNGKGFCDSRLEYEKIVRPTLFGQPQMEDEFIERMKELKSKGQVTLELIINGAFWEPREIIGIEPHMYSFYDDADFYHLMVEDMLKWQKGVIEYASNTLDFDFVTIAEDMSYNNGPMIGEDLFNEFIAPYYLKIVPLLKKAGMFVIVDSDGDISKALNWFERCGAQGFQPLERQSGLDIAECQKTNPNLAFIGHFDKMTMPKGEQAMRQEFERLLPLARNGKYIYSCDHQTPPSVSLENYKIYMRLLNEYCIKGAQK